MYESKPYLYGTGRRKNSVARVRLYPGTGKITINARDIDDYFGLETLKLIVRQPLALTDTLGRFDVVATVAGGRNNIPIETRILATTISITRNGIKITKPILKDVFNSLITKAGMRV